MERFQNESENEVNALLMERIPFLRRFARAVSGDQTVGDMLVLATLQRITNDRHVLRSASRPTLSLYKTFIEVLKGPVGQSCRESAEQNAYPYGCDVTISQLTPETRQAFLLTTMEQFNESEAAEIMAMDFDDFEDLLSEARREVAEQLSASVFIIEDEMFIASDLEEIVKGLGHLVVGTARTREEAVKKLQQIPADVILSDINLADGSSGIDAVNELLEVQNNVTVIFITAYSERLLTGIRPEPTFLIEKPYTTDQIRAVLSQVLFLRQTTSLPVNTSIEPLEMIKPFHMTQL